jgi:hypothetical protein
VSSVILTSYFTKNKHPNDPNDDHVIGRNELGYVDKDSFSYIKKWYDSIIENDLKAFVFHDDLSEDFVSEYQTQKIKFIKVDSSEYSNNDWRFFCYKDFLEENKFDSVFLSDCSDVVAVKKPCEIFNDFLEFDFFVCKDSIKLYQFPYCNLHKQEGWEDHFLFLLNQNNWDLINMGVIGAGYEKMLDFLNKFCDTRSRMKCDKSFNANMWVGQYIFRSLLKDKKTLIGYPFTSEFKSYQENSKEVYFIHK